MSISNLLISFYLNYAQFSSTVLQKKNGGGFYHHRSVNIKIDYSATFMVNGAEYTETASRYVTIRDEIIKEGNFGQTCDFICCI